MGASSPELNSSTLSLSASYSTVAAGNSTQQPQTSQNAQDLGGKKFGDR